MSSMKECTLTDSELIDKVDMWVTDLTHSGGKKWCLRVPADHNHDPDFIFTEAARRMIRYASRISELEAENKRLREKAEKWDALAAKMEKFYAEDSDADLVVIGEAAAAAFGYL